VYAAEKLDINIVPEKVPNKGPFHKGEALDGLDRIGEAGRRDTTM
jgi:hypothetical protein